MFTLVSSEIATRMLSSRKLLSFAKSLEEVDVGSAAVCKGLLFVQIYSTYEYAVRSAVQATLLAIKADDIPINQLRKEVLCLALEPHWKSAADAGRSKVWERRLNLMDQVGSRDSTYTLSDAVFPNDGSHYRVRQLHTIWKIFAVSDPVVPDPRLLGRIEELVENRNAIAHGGRTADEVGRRYSRQDIEIRLADAETICNYVVDTLRAHHESGALVAS